MTFIAPRNRIAGIICAAVIILLFVSPAINAQDRGDLNLNGVPYEIADALIYEAFFNIGLTAFTINIEAQIATTDINMDGIPLTYADYLFMLRIIGGEADPDYPPIDTVKALTFTELTDSSLIVYGWFDDEIGMLTLEFTAQDLTSYDVHVMPAAEDMELEVVYSELLGQLSVFLRSTLFGGGSIPADFLPIMELLFESNKAAPELNTALANGYGGEAVSFATDEMIIELGDINDNGIEYEIADAVLLSHALGSGVSVFTQNPQLQILNSDCDQDGIPVAVGDFEYVILVILGEIYPGDPVGSTFAGEIASVETDGLITLTTGFENPVGSMMLKYYAPNLGNYTVNTTVAIPDINLSFWYSDDTLKILLDNMSGPGVRIPSALSNIVTITYDGDAPLFLSATADAAGATSAEPVDLFASSCGDELGDCDGTPGTNLADILHIIGSVYGDGPDPIPHPVRSADVNCDCAVNLTDILNLINYIYGTEGPTPCSCSEWLTQCSQW